MKTEIKKLQNEVERTNQMSSALADEALNFERIDNQLKALAEARGDKLASIAAEFERVVIPCSRLEAELLISGVRRSAILSQRNSENPSEARAE